MVNVRLAKEWTDADGVTHAAGDTVDVDETTLASLQKDGVVSGETANWAGPTGTDDANWAGPTGGDEANWAGPTGAQP